MNLSGSSILITGGTGSFGQAMTERLLAMADGPSRIAIFSRDEVKQAEMGARLHDDSRLRFVLGDVRDRERLDAAMRDVHVVFHAAALKRVESCAYSPGEAVKTNVLGSMNVAAAAIEAGVRRLVALSTDKACAPSTTYGATKLCMEQVFTSSTAFAERAGSGTAFAVVRYGNVAGARGSVIPLWREAIAAGRPVPLVDPQATRFWFTLRGAVDLALGALEWMRGGELFVPRLPAFYVGHLAQAMGAVACERIPMRTTEKLHESMVSRDESAWFRSFEHGLARFLPGTERGDRLPDGFEYTSAGAELMGIEALRAALEGV